MNLVPSATDTIDLEFLQRASNWSSLHAVILSSVSIWYSPGGERSFF